MDRKEYIAQIKRELGLDQPAPRFYFPIDEEDVEYFREWYEEELISLYERIKAYEEGENDQNQ